MTDYHDLMDAAIDELKARGVPVPEEIKRRDKREPKRREKMDVEDRLLGAFHKHFKRQLAAVLSHVENRTGRKDWGIEIEPDDDMAGRVVRYLITAAMGGVDLFGEQIRIGINYSLTNDKAATWARNYAYDLIKDINATTQKLVSSAVNDFVQTPGMTVADLRQRLAPTFGDLRASKIAVTETTRAYAQGWRMAGDDLKADYPDLRIIKTWFTNADDVVCDVCGPLHGVTVDFDEDFAGVDEPPAHPNCRCWTIAGVQS